MSVYILNAGQSGEALDAVERLLEPAIPGLKRIGSVEDIGKSSFKSGGRAFVILVAGSADKQDLAALADGVISRHRTVFFLVVSDDISARDYKHLIQFGNADWAAESGLPREALDILRKVDATPTVAVASQRPVVVSFVPSAGGVGNSTLSMETAVQLIKRKADKEMQDRAGRPRSAVEPRLRLSGHRAQGSGRGDHRGAGAARRAAARGLRQPPPKRPRCLRRAAQSSRRPPSQRRRPVGAVRPHGAPLRLHPRRSAARGS